MAEPPMPSSTIRFAFDAGIGFTSSPGIAVLTGCAGTSAKSSDEIGRLGAELLMTGEIAPQGYATDFKPAFR